MPLKPSLFIGSSTESLQVAYAVQEELESDAEVTVWTQGTAELSGNLLVSLVRTIRETDFAVFVFNPDDVLQMRKHEYQVVRDNVVFELGMAMGSLGPERSFLVVPKDAPDLRLPSDLAGVTTAQYDSSRQDGNLRAAVGPASNRIRQIVLQYARPTSARPVPVECRIGVSGSMSVGKKTLVAALQRRLEEREDVSQVAIFSDVGRTLIEEGRSSDKATRFRDYPEYFRRHLNNVLGRPTGCTFHIRTVFDTIAYARVNGNLSGDWMPLAEEIGRLCSEKFDSYFYIPVEAFVPLEADGVRSTDPVYRERIDAAIKGVLREFVPTYVELRGTVEDRAAVALNEVDRLAARRA